MIDSLCVKIALMVVANTSHHAMIDEGCHINEVYACTPACVSVNIVLGGTDIKSKG